jgi:hypothetical protein
MPRRRTDPDVLSYLELLPAERQQEILEHALVERAHEIVRLHLDKTIGEFVDALRADPAWSAIRGVSTSSVLARHRHPHQRQPIESKNPLPLPEGLKNDLRHLLHQHKGNISAVAREMGKHRFQIQRWIKRLDYFSDR